MDKTIMAVEIAYIFLLIGEVDVLQNMDILMEGNTKILVNTYGISLKTIRL